MPYEKEEDERSDVNWDRFVVRGYESWIWGQLLYYCPKLLLSSEYYYLKPYNLRALCHNEQTASLPLNFGFGHVRQYTPFILNFSALHFTHSYTT